MLLYNKTFHMNSLNDLFINKITTLPVKVIVEFSIIEAGTFIM